MIFSNSLYIFLALFIVVIFRSLYLPFFSESINLYSTDTFEELTSLGIEPLLDPFLVSWNTVEYESGWHYDLFTPPSIFYDESKGCFTSHLEEDLNGIYLLQESLYLSAIYHPEYRFQFKGYHGNPDEYTVVIYDLKTKAWISTKIDEVNDAFVLKSFSIQEMELYLWDKEQGKEYCIGNRKNFDERCLAILCDKNASEFVLAEKQAFSFLNYDLLLRSINEIEGSVTLSIYCPSDTIERFFELKLTQAEGKEDVCD